MGTYSTKILDLLRTIFSGGLIDNFCVLLLQITQLGCFFNQSVSPPTSSETNSLFCVFMYSQTIIPVPFNLVLLPHCDLTERLLQNNCIYFKIIALLKSTTVNLAVE